MIHTYYIITIVLISVLTFYLTRRHYYRPSAPLPANSSTQSITMPSTSMTELETPQDGINKIVDALDANTKHKNAPVKPKSWLDMN